MRHRRTRPRRSVWPLLAWGVMCVPVVASGAGGLPDDARGACRLALTEHRTDRPLAVVATRPGGGFEIAFEHSVLGTTVVDRYRVVRTMPASSGHAIRLVEERFAGFGYGLPDDASTLPDVQPGGPGIRDGAEGRRLALDRPVDPLVVRPSRDSRTRLRAGPATVLPLSDLTDRGIRFEVTGCDD